METNLRKIFDGLRPLPPDSRDFKLGDLIDFPALSDLPASYTAGLPPIIDQDTPLNPNTDFCAAAASCCVLELREGIQLGYEWAFAVGKWMSGDIEAFGIDLRTMCSVYTTYGVIEASQSPFTMATQPSEFLRNIDNWPETLFELALAHKQGSYISVTGPYDAYDNIRATMWKFQNEKCGVLFGVIWGWPLSQTIMDTIPTSGSGHALAQIGWDEQGIFVQNSAGPNAGIGGRHYFTRDVINDFVALYGSFIIHPLTAGTVQTYLASGVKLDDNVLMRWLKISWAIIKGKI